MFSIYNGFLCCNPIVSQRASVYHFGKGVVGNRIQGAVNNEAAEVAMAKILFLFFHGRVFIELTKKLGLITSDG